MRRLVITKTYRYLACGRIVSKTSRTGAEINSTHPFSLLPNCKINSADLPKTNHLGASKIKHLVANIPTLSPCAAQVKNKITSLDVIKTQRGSTIGLYCTGG